MGGAGHRHGARGRPSRICGAHASHSPQAHAHALALACAMAAGEPPPDTADRIATERRLAAEMIDIHLRRLLLDWPPSVRLRAAPEPLRRIPSPVCSGRSTTTPHSLLGGEVLDLVAREMLAGFFNQIRMPHGIGEFLDRLAGRRQPEFGAERADRAWPVHRAAGAARSSCSARSAPTAWVAAVGRVAERGVRPPPALRRRAGRDRTARAPRRRRRWCACCSSAATASRRACSPRRSMWPTARARMRYPFSEDVAPLIDACQAAPGGGHGTRDHRARRAAVLGAPRRGRDRRLRNRPGRVRGTSSPRAPSAARRCALEAGERRSRALSKRLDRG